MISDNLVTPRAISRTISEPIQLGLQHGPDSNGALKANLFSRESEDEGEKLNLSQETGQKKDCSGNPSNTGTKVLQIEGKEPIISPLAMDYSEVVRLQLEKLSKPDHLECKWIFFGEGMEND